MEFIFVLIFASLFTADALPMKWFISTQEGVDSGYPVNTKNYYYVPYFSPFPHSPHQLIIDPVFELGGINGIEHKHFLSHRTIFNNGLFSTADTDSVEIYANPIQEFFHRFFLLGMPVRIWSWIMGNKPMGATGVSAIINNPGVSSSPIVDSENESVIIEAD